MRDRPWLSLSANWNSLRGLVGSKHRHPGPLVVCVLEGSLEIQLEGASPNTYQRGECFTEEPHQLHVYTRNPSRTRSARVISYILSRNGEALSQPACISSQAKNTCVTFNPIHALYQEGQMLSKERKMNRAVLFGKIRWGKITFYEVYEDTERVAALDGHLADRSWAGRLEAPGYKRPRLRRLTPAE